MSSTEKPEVLPDYTAVTQPYRHTPEAKRRAGRSRVSNTSTTLPTTDGRSLWARIRKDTYHSLIQHAGGEGVVSETQQLEARRVASLEATLVFIEDQFAKIYAAGGEPEVSRLDSYGRLADRQRRIIGNSLGWKRASRDVTPSLGDLLRQDQQHEPELIDED